MAKADWEALRCFMLVVQTGSLSAASEAASLSVATLGRRIDALEHALDLKLVKRGTRGAHPTQHGQRIYEQVAAGALHLEQIDRIAATMSEDAKSEPIRISSTEPVVSEILAPHVHILRETHPEIRLVLEVSLSPANLNRGDADIAVRLFKPKEDTLIMQKLPEIDMGLFATQGYLDSRGSADTQNAALALLWYDDLFGDIPENLWLTQNGLAGQVLFRSSSVRALTYAACSGLGAAPLPRFIGVKHGLVQLPKVHLPTRTPWVAFHRDDRNKQVHKIVRNWIKTCFQKATQPPEQ